MRASPILGLLAPFFAVTPSEKNIFRRILDFEMFQTDPPDFFDLYFLFLLLYRLLLLHLKSENFRKTIPVIRIHALSGLLAFAPALRLGAPSAILFPSGKQSLISR